MKLTKLFLITALGAGSLQASILYNQTTGLGLSAGPSSILQNFSTPSLTQQSVIATSGNTATQFAGLTLEANTSLYYDPNGAAGCGLGSNLNGSPTLPALSACVGNYSLSDMGVGSNQSTVQSGFPALPFVNMDFSSPVFATSFLFAAPSAGANTLTFEVQLFAADGHTQIDSTLMFKATLSAPAYFVITEAQAFSFVDITQLTSSGAKATAGTTGEGVFLGATTFNALIGDVQASTAPVPEPGTIGLLSLGLAGIGYFVRRRKA